MKAATVLALLAAQLTIADDNVPDMLEKALPAVVMVDVRKGQDRVEVRGLASDVAYRKIELLPGVEYGSGFVIEKAGRKYIVTNAHVVEMAEGNGSLVVYTYDHTPHAATLAALDSLYDLAVLTFDEPPAASAGTLKFSNGKVRIGETVYAIGNPLGSYPYTVTSGIIGGLHRRFPLPELSGKFGFLQSSATVSEGNSGGPLLNAAGEVVGVNTKIASARVDNTNVRSTYPQLNFSLEASAASRLIDEMLANGGRLKRAYLGVEITHDVDQDGRPYRDSLPTLAGVLPGSPAAAALSGKIGYTVRKIGGFDIADADDALEAFEGLKPNEPVRLELSAPRTGKIEVVTFTAGSLTDENAAVIGQYLLKREVSASMVENGDGVQLHPGPTPIPAPNAGTRVSIRDPRELRKGARKVSFQPIKQVPPATPVIGVASGTEMYNVKSLRDLGVAVKLIATRGELDFLFLVKGDPEPKSLHLLLSGGYDFTRRTLFY